MKVLDSHENGELLIRTEGDHYVRDEDGNWFKPPRWKYGKRESVFPRLEDNLEDRFQALKQYQN